MSSLAAPPLVLFSSAATCFITQRPPARTNFGACLLGDFIYVFGGEFPVTQDAAEDEDDTGVPETDSAKSRGLYSFSIAALLHAGTELGADPKPLLQTLVWEELNSGNDGKGPDARSNCSMGSTPAPPPPTNFSLVDLILSCLSSIRRR